MLLAECNPSEKTEQEQKGKKIFNQVPPHLTSFISWGWGLGISLVSKHMLLDIMTSGKIKSTSLSSEKRKHVMIREERENPGAQNTTLGKLQTCPNGLAWLGLRPRTSIVYKNVNE